jgi:predicted ATPase with chaperone activity
MALNYVEAASDIHLDVQRVPYQKLTAIEGGEKSAVIRARIEAARERQQARFAKLDKPGPLVNGDMGSASAAFEPRRMKRCAALLPDRRGLNVQVARASRARLCARWT